MLMLSTQHVLPADQIIINKEIGRGEFGVVQQGTWNKETGERIKVAIKCLSKQRMHNNSMEFLKEAAIMHSISNPHIVQLFGVVLDGNSLMLVTELAPLRSLLECLRDQSIKLSFTVSSLCDFAYQICSGMAYLEAMQIVHRDLFAARNILVFTKNLVKISDFGLSRALGVGKDYYQISAQNCNDSLKLPIAWCAPECITYNFKFTSASDVWSYAVTMWEMFSYGYEPWIGLEGKDIIAAIDEPNFQRLDQPDYCPKEYYSIMLKCWAHDAAQRPKFSEILNMLPDCKPELVQAVKDCTPDPIQIGHLQIKINDVITVLDKTVKVTSIDLSSSIKTMWKGCTNDGRVGLFNPNSTISYLGQNLPNCNTPTSPTNNANQQSTQNGHMKLSVFIKSFLEKGISHQQNCSKKKIKPEMISNPKDLQHTGHVGADGVFFGDISYLGDKYQLIPNRTNDNSYKPINGSLNTISLSRNSSDISDKTPLLNNNSKDIFKDSSLKRNATNKLTLNTNGNSMVDHEYHEIGEDETPCSPKSKPFDFGPPLLEAVLKDLKLFNYGSNGDLEKEFISKNSTHNEKQTNEKSNTTLLPTKKKQANLKSVSAAEQKSLDSAIAMVLNHFDSTDKCDSMNLLDNCSVTADSPKFSVTSPTKKKFTFKFNKSSKSEQKTFTDQLNNKQQDNIVDSILPQESGKEAYESLVESGTIKKQQQTKSAIFSKNLSRSSLPRPPPIPCNQPCKSSQPIVNRSNNNQIINNPPSLINQQQLSTKTAHRQQQALLISNLDVQSPSPSNQPNLNFVYPPNPPLPPRSDRTKSLIQLKHHERRHTLIIPDQMDGSEILNTLQATNNKIYRNEYGIDLNKPKLMSTFKPNMPLHRNMSFSEATSQQHSSPTATAMTGTPQQRCCQIPIEMFTGLPIVQQECRTPGGTDKDIVEFKFENQNIKIDVSKLRLEESSSLMQKVLTYKVSSEDCVTVLKKCDCDVYKSIKVIQLRETLKQQSIVKGDNDYDWIEILTNFNWDVGKAVSSFVARSVNSENGTTAV